MLESAPMSKPEEARYTQQRKRTMGRYRYTDWLVNAAYCLVTFCLVDPRPLLAGGVVKLAIALVFACLLSFVAVHSSNLGSLVIACLTALPKGLFPFRSDRRWIERSETTLAVVNEPSFSLLFQRPPPSGCY
jgi:hypothetical protein